MEFKLPELGENIDEAEVAELLVKEGDTVEADQAVMELETEKAVVELPAPQAGKIEKVHVAVGDTIKVGAVVLTIADADESDTADDDSEKKDDAEEKTESEAEAESEQESESKEKTKSKGKSESKEKSDSQSSRKTAAAEKSESAPQRRKEPAAGSPDNGRGGDGPPPPAGPATRQMARKLGVDLHKIQGTGPGGRILQEDVEGFVRNVMADGGAPGGRAATPPLPDFTKFGEVEEERLSKLHRTAANQLSTSWQNIPHVTQHELADVTELEAARKQYMQTAGKSGPKMTMAGIAVKACAQLLQEFPKFNSSLDVDRGVLIVKKHYHIGVAVDTEYGLVVPVIRDADVKTLREISKELIELAELARERKLELLQMQGATFTITNLGGIGGSAFTPIVNWPEVAILGVSRSRKELRMVDGRPQERLVMPLSLSYDHRVVNGADAARFVVRLTDILRDPFSMLVDS